MKIKDTIKERSNGNKAASTHSKRTCTNNNNNNSGNTNNNNNTTPNSLMTPSLSSCCYPYRRCVYYSPVTIIHYNYKDNLLITYYVLLFHQSHTSLTPPVLFSRLFLSFLLLLKSVTHHQSKLSQSTTAIKNSSSASQPHS